MVELLAEKTAKAIRRCIAQGSYAPGGRLETERRLCEKFAVSRTTIRAALSMLETDGWIRKLPRRGIEVTAGAAARRGEAKKQAVAMTYVYWRDEPFEAAMIRGVRRAAEEVEAEISVVNARGSWECYVDAIRHAPTDVEGLLVHPFEHPEIPDAVEAAMARGRKVVLIDRLLDSVGVSCVSVDNYAGGYESTRHLIETHGCGVHYLGPTRRPLSSVDRCSGWASAMCEQGFPDGREYVISIGDDDFDTTDFDEWRRLGREHASELFRAAGRGTYCIFAANDAIAGGVYEAAGETGLAVGRDVFVVGFDDLPLCGRMDPPLSSVRQPREELGHQAARQLLAEISDPQRRPIRNVLPVQLMIRSSSTVRG